MNIKNFFYEILPIFISNHLTDALEIIFKYFAVLLAMPIIVRYYIKKEKNKEYHLLVEMFVKMQESVSKLNEKVDNVLLKHEKSIKHREIDNIRVNNLKETLVLKYREITTNLESIKNNIKKFENKTKDFDYLQTQVEMIRQSIKHNQDVQEESRAIMEKLTKLIEQYDRI
jgi:hypothetical protein